ncbi:(3S,6E)-nerolidol synthase 1-like, partial [Cucurbita pepo subsp. pepo]|uniref:(3S,6E)-nerolidol synthase 1-like n=1 Tax=Cucurbita pepo subsp. pepo TaxID=3664 RepID=UPI000C9D96C5
IVQDGYGVEGAVAKVESLKHVLRESGDCLERLDLIDAAQRLGIDNHLQEEIEAVLKRQYFLLNALQFDPMIDLHKAALLFRLLTQQGFLVTPNLFKIFLDEEGKFNKELRHDIKGLTSLHEASQLCMHGDDILEEAQNFSSHWLNAWVVVHVNHHSATFVHNTLLHPYHKTLPQFMLPNYFGDNQWTNKWIHTLQGVAKVNFNTTQRLRQYELNQFTKWWKESDLGRELNFARNQPMKWYIASLSCLTDVCHSEQRIQLAKAIAFVYLIDDIFDVFGTLEELTMFTEVVCRWDLVAAEKLPSCMRICFKSLFVVTNEISDQIYQKHGWNPATSLQTAWGKLCKAFLVEAEWFSSGHWPSAEEYLRNGRVSTGVHVTLVHVFFLLGHQIRQQTVELLEGDLDIVWCSATILRLWDDMGSAKDENQEGRDGSYVKYYMKEHPSTSFNATQKHIMWKISEAWKSLNREWLHCNPLFPSQFTQASLNIARAVPLFYSYGRNQSFPTFEQHMERLLFHSLDI